MRLPTLITPIVVAVALNACATEGEPTSVAASEVTTCSASPPSDVVVAADVVTHPGLDEASKCTLARDTAQPGDLVFSEIASNPVGQFVFSRVAELTSSWTSHVGIVLREQGELMVAESTLSTFDWRSRKTPLCEFLSHSRRGRFALRRLPGLTPARMATLERAIDSRIGQIYDTGFDLDSPGKSYCSRFVREVFATIGEDIGRIQTLRELVDEKKAEDPSWDDTLIRLWFLQLQVPWCRRMVTPASQLWDPRLRTLVATD